MRHLRASSGHPLKWAAGGVVSLSVALTVTAAACGVASDSQTFARGELARVDSEVVTADELRQRFWQGPQDVRKQALRRGGRHALLDLVIDERLLYAEAKRRNLAPAFSDLWPFHEKLMKRFLAKEFEPTVRASEITEEQLQAEYERVRNRLTAPPRKRIRVFTAKTREEAEALLAEVRTLSLEGNEASLSELLSSQRDESLGAQMGDFERENAVTYLGEEVAEAAWDTDVDVGVAPEPVRFHDGWAVVNVMADYGVAEPPPFETVKGQMRERIFARLREKALNRFVSTFRDRHEVAVHQDVMDLVPWTAQQPLGEDGAPPPAADGGPAESEGSPAP